MQCTAEMQLSDESTFRVSCYFRASPFYRLLLLCTFSQGLLFQMMLFSTANLIFTVTLSNHHLLISYTNTEVFTLKSPSGAQSGLLSQGSIEQENLWNKLKSFSS